MPTTKFDSKAESTVFELLPDGDYPFQIIAADFGISKGPKVAGSEDMDLKVAFYKDGTFEKKIAQWTEGFIFHPSCEWKLSVFTKCANMLIDGQPPDHGADIEYSPDTVVGLRGWATVRNKPSQTDKEKRYNYVASWLTNKAKIPRAPVTAPAEAPAQPQDDPDWT